VTAVQLELFPETRPPREALLNGQRALQGIYDALAVQWGLAAARVVVTTRRATGGVIQYGPPHVIRVSGHMSSEDQKATLLHETAHAVCHARWGADEGHSRRFWKIALQLGVTRKSAPETDRLHAIRIANSRYTYRCVGCASEWTRRKPFGNARLCASCDGKGRPSRLILVRRPPRARRAPA
jgi:predicted SprT family Zn-dependent metalloprotease